MPEGFPYPPVTRAHLVVAAIGMLLLPLGLRTANRFHPFPHLQPSYLPALEGPRERAPFDPSPISDLRRLDPAWVVIGDSMAGTRIDVPLFTRLTRQSIAPILHPGSGSAWWYLVLRNWVIASGVRPRAVFVFFRDTNLTDVLFRIDATAALDRAAHDREDDLNGLVSRRRGGSFFRVHQAVDEVYQATQVRRWLEPLVDEWPARAMIPYRKPRAAFMDRLNDRLGLAHLRPMDAADMQATEDREADFDANVDRSVLPLMLHDAQAAGVHLCFVRVQRRPIEGAPPYQSPGLRRYVARLRAYIQQRGAIFVDDTGDPAQPLAWYEDGDHLSSDGRRRYTELFVSRLDERAR